MTKDSNNRQIPYGEFNEDKRNRSTEDRTKEEEREERLALCDVGSLDLVLLDVLLVGRIGSVEGGSNNRS